MRQAASPAERNCLISPAEEAGSRLREPAITDGGPSERLATILHLMAPLVALAVVIAFVAQLPPNTDVAWQLWVGRQLGAGARLYRDIMEVNPPLWFWFGLPLVRTAALLHVSGYQVLLGFLALSAVASLMLSLTKWRLPMVAAFFLFGISATGQREQFTLIAVTPYVFLCAERAREERVPLARAVAIAVWAALGVALKPYFALVPIALGLWLLVRTRKVWPELIVIAALCSAYLLTVLWLCPDYLYTVDLGRRFYGAYDVGPLTLLLSDTTIVSLLAIIGLLVGHKDEDRVALIIAGTAFFAAYLMQLKGFRYHGLPAIGLFCMAALASLRFTWRAVPLVLALLYAFATTLNQRSLPDPDALAATATLPPGSSLLVESPYSAAAWPLVEIRHYRWMSPFGFYWTHTDTAFTARIARADISRHPDRVLIDDRLGAAAYSAGYRSVGKFGHYTVFVPR